MAMATSDAKPKAGIWTEHVDPSSGRTYFFNMVQNRSYWQLPEEHLAQVKKPVIETLREWDSEAAARYEQPSSAKDTEDGEQQRKKREELLVAAAAAQANELNPSANGSAIHERMALAAAQKRAEEMKQRMTAQHKLKEQDTASANNGYLSMVRELQAKDRDTESSGGKWLVR